MNYERRFWRELERYHDLAERVDRNTYVTHPSSVTSRRIACKFCYHCIWGASSVTYYEYRGESLT